jgi:hypothetical protein
MSPAPGRASPAPGRNSPAPYAQAPRPLTPTGRARAASNASAFVPYQPQNGTQSPGPNGSSRLRPQEAPPASRRRSNSMSQVSGLRTEAQPQESKIPVPVGQVARKPVPGQSA